ncbi:Lactate utilization protein LUD domain-containing [Desulfonema limicola]|uniref:Lactate utilization protein LUD domain-containing n=1 Tax=Desulfonema limicola TaxID=45656 RepID=A0A975BB99_9BACT|nr:lactate utilization protein [Desulfonema limicola]QTA82128.1 Lactate utilization protein LUD domain-containing [Desulfonema limicola]
MNDNTRTRIFARLESAVQHGSFNISEPGKPEIPDLDKKQKIDLLKKNMEAVRTQVHVVEKEKWIDILKNIIKDKNINSLVYGPGTEIGTVLEQSLGEYREKLIKYDRDIEDFKSIIFESDAGITTTLGAAADTGALILWPDEKEPRLISLVPSIHIAVLKAENIYAGFSQAVEKQRWAEKMPTNALLISGPSKTADIELTLAFGVHGPKELIVLVLD